MKPGFLYGDTNLEHPVSDICEDQSMIIYGRVAQYISSPSLSGAMVKEAEIIAGG